jgi:arylsulfatase A-like enzyme
MRLLRLLATSLFGLVAASGCAASRSGEQPMAPTSTARPNVIVIMADDLGYADVSIYHKGRIPTPNLDRLGREGVVFTQGYVSTPICSPSRAALMTGRYQQRYGFEHNNGPAARDAGERLGLDPAELTLGDVLKAGGYRTGVVGKWHLGSSDEHYPTNRGFETWWGFLTGQTNFIHPNAPGAVNGAPASTSREAGSIAQPVLQVSRLNAIITGPDRTVIPHGEWHLTEELTKKSIEFIDSSGDRPFFLYLAHHAPHTPLQTTQKYYDRFPNIADKGQRVYAGMVSALDDSIGDILNHLEKRGISDNTIVVFLSDNGCAAYLPGLCSPEPLSGGKLSHYEGGIRVPFLMRWPAAIPAGTVHDKPVSSLDVFPTAVKAAGLQLPADRVFDGKDLVAQVRAGASTPERQLVWRSTPLRTVRQGDWKYHRDFDGNEFLYNLRTDPKERVNLAKQEPQRLAELQAVYALWERDKKAPAWPGRFTEYDFDGRHFKFAP